MGAMKASEFNTGRIVEAKRLELNAWLESQGERTVSQERLADAYVVFAIEARTRRQVSSWLRGGNDAPGRQLLWLCDAINSLIPAGCPVEPIVVPPHEVKGGRTPNPKFGLKVKAA